jgi:hypothetical protein
MFDLPKVIVKIRTPSWRNGNLSPTRLIDEAKERRTVTLKNDRITCKSVPQHSM